MTLYESSLGQVRQSGWLHAFALLTVILICSGKLAVGGGGLPSVLAETRWLETAFSHLEQSCGVENNCVKFVSLEISFQ